MPEPRHRKDSDLIVSSTQDWNSASSTKDCSREAGPEESWYQSLFRAEGVQRHNQWTVEQALKLAEAAQD